MNVYMSFCMYSVCVCVRVYVCVNVYMHIMVCVYVCMYIIYRAQISAGE